MNIPGTYELLGFVYKYYMWMSLILFVFQVQNNLCTPKNGEILVASTQDFLTSSFLITRKDTFYDRSTFSLICSYMGDGMDIVDLPTPAIIKVRVKAYTCMCGCKWPHMYLSINLCLKYTSSYLGGFICLPDFLLLQ